MALVTSLATNIAKPEKASAARINIIMEDAPIIVSFLKTVQVNAKIDYNNSQSTVFFIKLMKIILMFIKLTKIIMIKFCSNVFYVTQKILTYNIIITAVSLYYKVKKNGL